jgi:Flp pilus assembly protein CpaB
MRGRVLFIIAFLLIIVVAAAAIVWVFFFRQPKKPTVVGTPTPKPVKVLYITQNIPKGTKLDETMLSSIPWQANAVAPGMFQADQVATVKGRVVKYDLTSGTPLLDSMLLKENEIIQSSGSSWALSISTGMVAVSIPVDRLANVSFAPRPGDHVSVIVSLMFVDVDTDFQSILPNFTGLAIGSGPPDPETKMNPPLTVAVGSLGPAGAVDPETGQPVPPSPLNPGIYGKVLIDPVLGQAVYVVPAESQRARFVSHMLLQNAVVLQVGNFPLPGQEATAGTPTPTPQEGQGEQAPAPPAPPDVITLIVRPQDAVALNYILLAQEHLAARLSLVLRGANDDTRENTLPVTLQFLLEQYQIPVPARLPYSLNPRIDRLGP